MKKILKHLRKNWIRHGFETLVVTIGILGAFTLNTWNEQRIQNNRINSILSFMEAELIQDSIDLQSNIEVYNLKVSQIDSALNKKRKWSYNDFLIRTFDMRTLAYNQYESITSDLSLSQDSLIIRMHLYYQSRNEVYKVLFNHVRDTQKMLDVEMLSNYVYYEDFYYFKHRPEMDDYFDNNELIRRKVVAFRNGLRLLKNAFTETFIANKNLLSEIRKLQINRK